MIGCRWHELNFHCHVLSLLALQNKLGDTALHAAAWKGYADIVEVLLAKGNWISRGTCALSITVACPLCCVWCKPAYLRRLISSCSTQCFSTQHTSWPHFKSHWSFHYNPWKKSPDFPWIVSLIEILTSAAILYALAVPGSKPHWIQWIQFFWDSHAQVAITACNSSNGGWERPHIQRIAVPAVLTSTPSNATATRSCQGVALWAVTDSAVSAEVQNQKKDTIEGLLCSLLLEVHWMPP